MLRVKLWGTRGSIVSPGKATLCYGGNTSCVEVVAHSSEEPGAAISAKNPRLLLDGGTGLAALQPTLMRGSWGKGRGSLNILLSHYHWDHLIGLPFFGPMFVPGNKVTFLGLNVEDLRSSIDRLFTSVYSPIKGTENLAATLSYEAVVPEGMELDGFRITAARTRHPATTVAFRIDHEGTSLVYCTDHECGDPEVDSRLVELSRGADLFIIDAQFTAEQAVKLKGYGHSSFEEAVSLALKAQVSTAVLFHHNPEHDDAELDRIGARASELVAKTKTHVLVGRDGLVLTLGRANKAPSGDRE